MVKTRLKPSSRKKSARSSGRSAPSRKSQAGRSSSQRSQQSSRSSSRQSQPSTTPPLGKISPERKIDLAGLVMALVGLLTMLSLFSNQAGGLTGYWVSALKSVFGWGVYILPAGLILLGAWLVARHVERLPVLSIERIIGILLLFVGLLVAFHGLSGSAVSALERAR